MKMLEIKDLTVQRGKKTVLENLSFRVEQGSFTAVLGKNGAGKSTLLSAIASLLPHSGEIFFESTPLKTFSAKERAKRISFLPQMLESPPFTVEELVLCGRNPYLSFPYHPSAEDRETVEKILALTDTAMFRDRLVSTLSGGERQRAFLAMALAQGAPVLLLDEPTSYMDIAAETAFFSLLRSLSQKENKTVLAAMHNLANAVRYAEHILILDGGEAVFYGSREECLAEGIIERIFGVRRYSDGDMHFFF